MGKLDYRTQGKTLKEFHDRANTDFIRVLLGPLGSGKTQACIVEILNRIDTQAPDNNNVRRSRWVVARNTQPDLHTTSITDFRAIVDQTELGVFTMGTPPTWKGGYKRKQDASLVEFEVLFLAFDHPQDSKKARGLQLTGVWFNEMKELARANVDLLTSRVGRYPPRSQCPNAWNGIIGDSNAPDRDHYLVKLALDVKPEGWWFGIQPGGVEKKGGEWQQVPGAENSQNLPVNYYQRLIAGRTDPWIRQNLANEFVFYADGRPVHPAFSESLHAQHVLRPTPAIPLVVGIDFGRTPAASINQVQMNGQWYMLDELCTENMGALEFGRQLKRFLNEKYAGFKLSIFGDPAGSQMSQTRNETPFDLLNSIGLDAQPAPSNDFEERTTALDESLTTIVEGQPAFLIDNSCRVAIKGLAGAYMFKRVQMAGEERYKDEPVKSPESHIVESIHYAMLGKGRGMDLFNSEWEEEYADVENWRPDQRRFE